MRTNGRTRSKEKEENQGIKEENQGNCEERGEKGRKK